MKLDASFDEFKTVLEIRNLSKSTFDTYCTWVRRFLEFLSSSGIEDTSDIELSHAREFTIKQNKKFSARTYNCCVCAVSYYYEGVLIKTFPRRYLPYAKVSRDNTDSFTEDQLWELIMKAPDSRLRAAIVLAADTGMRVNEVASIRFRDIDKKARTIVIETLTSVISGLIRTAIMEVFSYFVFGPGFLRRLPSLLYFPLFVPFGTPGFFLGVPSLFTSERTVPGLTPGFCLMTLPFSSVFLR